MKNLAKAVVAAMKEIKAIKKNSNVGTGNSAYKGVQDMDVKKAVGDAMENHGLCILPISIEPSTKIERWEDNSYGQIKQKQQVFTEVKTKYLLLHESGESVELAGYGHGVDSQDKSAGKATTYALKYALLYAFMIPTGDIDDTDNSHSDEKETPPVASSAARRSRRAAAPSEQEAPQQQSPPQQASQQQASSQEAPKERKTISLNVDDENWSKVINFVASNKAKGLTAIIKQLSTKYDMESLNDPNVQAAFNEAVK